MLSLVVPLGINASHYLLFDHHENPANKTLQFQNAEADHLICSYPFVTEEFINESIFIRPLENLCSTTKPAPTQLKARLSEVRFPGRAPPVVI